MTIINSLLLDILGCSPLIENKQSFQQVVQAGISAHFFHPNIQHFVHPVFEGKVLFAFDHIIDNPEVTEESLVVVDV